MKLQYKGLNDRKRCHLISFTNYTYEQVNDMNQARLDEEFDKTVRQREENERGKK